MGSQTVHLKLTPMQIPDAVQPSRVGGGGSEFLSSVLSRQQSGYSDNDVVIYPKEPSEIVLVLENQGTRHLQLIVELEGNFPRSWCRLGRSGYDLPPRSQMEAVLYFQTPTDIFEEQESLVGKESLLLDYLCRVQVYYIDDNERRQLIATTTLNLYVRPRSLYLNFVPALYREVDFIGRFLKIFEQAFEPANQTMNHLWAYLDPLTAPESLLPFLAHWVAWPMNNRWSIEQQRHLIRSAVELYRWRGTKRGLRLYIHLYTNLPLDDHITRETDKHISIQEISGQGLVLGDTRIGEDAMIGGGRPFHFIVRLRPERPNSIDEQLVRYIIDQEKPAFCTYELYLEESSLS